MAAAGNPVATLLRIMRARPDDAAVQERCCVKLQDLVRDHSGNASFEGAVDAVLAALSAHTAHAGVQVAGCRSLYFAWRAGVRVVHQAGAAVLLACLRALAAHPLDLNVQRNSCAFLGVVTDCSSQMELRQQAIDEGAVELVMAAMRVCTLMQVASSAAAVCCALANLQGCMGSMRRAGGSAVVLKALLPVLRAHGASAEVQYCGCTVLSRLCTAESSCAVAIGISGAVELMVAALRKHSTDEPVQLFGYLALDKLTELDGASAARAVAAGLLQLQAPAGVSTDALYYRRQMFERLRSSVGGAAAQAAVPEPLQEAAQQQTESRAADTATGAERACASAAADTAAAGGSSTSHPTADAAFAAVVRAMRAKPADADEQMRGCQLLRQHCKWHGNAMASSTVADVLDVLAAALDAHAADAVVQTAACWALDLVCVSCNATVDRGAAVSAVRSCVRALAAHPRNIRVLASGFGALGGLARHPEAAAEAINAGGDSLLLCALRMHRANGTVVECACFALTRLSAAADVANTRSVDIVLRALLPAMRAHGSNAAVQSTSFSFLTVLCVDNPLAAAAVGAAGVVELVVTALRSHATSLKVQESGYLALGVVTERDAACSRRAIHAGALQLPAAASEPSSSATLNRERLLRRLHGVLADAERAAAELTAAEDEEASAAPGRGAASSARTGKKKRKQQRKQQEAGAVEAVAAAEMSGASGSGGDDAREAAAGGSGAAASSDAPHAAALVAEQAQEAVADAGGTSGPHSQPEAPAPAAAVSETAAATPAAAAATDDAPAAAPMSTAVPDAPAAPVAATAPGAVVAAAAAAGDAAAANAASADDAAASAALIDELFPWMRIADEAPAPLPAPCAPLPATQPPPAPAAVVAAAGALPPLPAWLAAPPIAAAAATAAPPMPGGHDAVVAALQAQLTEQAAAMAAQAAALKAATDAAPMCAICLDAAPCVVLLPCRHQPLCASPQCFAMLGAPPLCPLCRLRVADTLQTFVS